MIPDGMTPIDPPLPGILDGHIPGLLVAFGPESKPEKFDPSSMPPPQSLNNLPLHSLTGLFNYACESRLPLGETGFDPRCKDCVTAAIGFLDAGQTDTRVLYAQNVTLHEFVLYAQYWIEHAEE